MIQKQQLCLHDVPLKRCPFCVNDFLLLFSTTYSLVHHNARTAWRLAYVIVYFSSKLNVRLLFNKITPKEMRRLVSAYKF